MKYQYMIKDKIMEMKTDNIHPQVILCGSEAHADILSEFRVSMLFNVNYASIDNFMGLDIYMINSMPADAVVVTTKEIFKKIIEKI